jgi:small GTP-binding protein
LSNPNPNNEYLFKICLIGSVTDIKRKFIRSFAENKFDTNYPPTLGVDITTKRVDVNGNFVKLILVDTAGQEFFGKLRPSYYRGASACIILFDKSIPKSFDAVPNWLKEFKKFINTDVPIALVGLTPKRFEGELISTEDGQSLADCLDLSYFEYSFSSPSRKKINRILFSLTKQVIYA